MRVENRRRPIGALGFQGSGRSTANRGTLGSWLGQQLHLSCPCPSGHLLVLPGSPPSSGWSRFPGIWSGHMQKWQHSPHPFGLCSRVALLTPDTTKIPLMPSMPSDPPGLCPLGAGRHSHQNLAAPKLGSASGQESHSSWGAARHRELPRAPPPVPCRTPGTICSPQGPGDLVNASPCPSLLLWATWGCTPRRFSASTPTLALLSATLTVTGLPVTSDPDTPPLDSA